MNICKASQTSHSVTLAAHREISKAQADAAAIHTQQGFMRRHLQTNPYSLQFLDDNASSFGATSALNQKTKFISGQSVIATFVLHGGYFPINSFGAAQAGARQMTRLFFDVVGQNERAFDYHGRYFRDENEAHEHAKLLSLDLSCTQSEGEIEVRDSKGQRLFTVPIVQVEELRPAA